MSEPHFTPRQHLEWKEVKYLKEPLTAAPAHATWQYTMQLPVPLSDWDVYDYWEKERIYSMREHLKKGDTLFDIGTEQGWCNIVYANFVGPENMVLIEPTQEFWPNIEAIWHKNYNVEPRGFYDGLLGQSTNDQRDIKELSTKWPEATKADLVDKNKYQYLHANDENVPELTVDDYVEKSGIVPDALTMDVEGAELLILKGAEKTLKQYHPKCWISVHDDLGRRDYDTAPEDTIAYMESLGYVGEHLATDHEAHWYFHDSNS